MVAVSPALAARVSVSVYNDASPRVWFVSPKDGERLPAGKEIVVRIESEHGERLSMTANGTPVWSVDGALIQGAWTPDAGRHTLVAVAKRDGRPDGVATIEVIGVKAAAASPGAAPASPVPPGSPRAEAAPTGSVPGSPVGAGGSPGPTSGSSRGLTPAPVGRGATPSVPASSGGGGAAEAPGREIPPAAGGTERSGDDGGGLGAWIAALFGNPERVAWIAALPLLLIAAGAGYLLLQRFIDGGQKLAWRVRGRPDDTIVEF